MALQGSQLSKRMEKGEGSQHLKMPLFGPANGACQEFNDPEANCRSEILLVFPFWIFYSNGWDGLLSAKEASKKGQGPVFVAYLCLIHSITINYYITEVQGVFTTSKSSQVQASFEDSDDQSLILYHPPQINAIQNGGKLLAWLDVT